jgi:CRISPR/Cas system CSM-associated protein Csm2 small subunit
MDTKKAAFLGLVIVLALFGCRKGNTDTSAVIAKVGEEKVTETQFRDLIMALAGDDEKAEEFLTDESLRGRRNEFLAKYLEGRGLMMLAKGENLDEDPKIRLQLDEAITQVYAQALLERRVGNLAETEPTEAQLRGIYDEIAEKQKAMGQKIPPFEEAKPHLPQVWKQKRHNEAADALVKEMKEKFPVTVEDGYKAILN